MAHGKGPLPRVEIGIHQGRRVLMWRGEPYFYTARFANVPGRLEERQEYIDRVRDACRPYAENGIHGYQLQVNIGWNGPGQWDPVNLKDLRDGCRVDDAMAGVLAADPEGPLAAVLTGSQASPIMT